MLVVSIEDVQVQFLPAGCAVWQHHVITTAGSVGGWGAREGCCPGLWTSEFQNLLIFFKMFFKSFSLH